MTVVLAGVIGVLFAAGTYLMLHRQLTRVIIGLALLAHGANLMIVFSRGGRAGSTFIGTGSEEGMLDPLPQAFVLTAIVIAFGTTALLLALAYRSWFITHNDEVEDDVEDRLVQHRRQVQESDALAAAEHQDFEHLDPDEAPVAGARQAGDNN
jgi:multicomponent Na+:H+ antiporter subunit C